MADRLDHLAGEKMQGYIFKKLLWSVDFSTLAGKKLFWTLHMELKYVFNHLALYLSILLKVVMFLYIISTAETPVYYLGV